VVVGIGCRIAIAPNCSTRVVLTFDPLSEAYHETMAPGTSDGISYLQRRDRIEQSKADWKMARFEPVPGDTEFIPLTEPEA